MLSSADSNISDYFVDYAEYNVAMFNQVSLYTSTLEYSIFSDENNLATNYSKTQETIRSAFADTDECRLYKVSKIVRLHSFDKCPKIGWTVRGILSDKRQKTESPLQVEIFK